METVFLYYSTLFITAVVYCVCTGASCSLALEYGDLIHLLADASMTQPSVSGAETATLVLGLPTAATAAISLWQMLVSILWHPAYGFTAGIVLLVWSAFSQTPIAIGDYAMMQRCERFCAAGLSSSGIWIVLASLAVCAGVGCYAMKHRDIIRPLRVGN